MEQVPQPDRLGFEKIFYDLTRQGRVDELRQCLNILKRYQEPTLQTWICKAVSDAACDLAQEVNMPVLMKFAERHDEGEVSFSFVEGFGRGLKNLFGLNPSERGNSIDRIFRIAKLESSIGNLIRLARERGLFESPEPVEKLINGASLPLSSRHAALD